MLVEYNILPIYPPKGIVIIAKFGYCQIINYAAISTDFCVTAFNSFDKMLTYISQFHFFCVIKCYGQKQHKEDFIHRARCS